MFSFEEIKFQNKLIVNTVRRLTISKMSISEVIYSPILFVKAEIASGSLENSV